MGKNTVKYLSGCSAEEEPGRGVRSGNRQNEVIGRLGPSFAHQELFPSESNRKLLVVKVTPVTFHLTTSCPVLLFWQGVPLF